jgi:epoxyqueuosine reductase
MREGHVTGQGRAGESSGGQAAPASPQVLLAQLRQWARELGFSQIGVADVDLSSAEAGLLDWLAAGFHGGMGYMAAHGLKRARPAELRPGTLRVVTARMDYLGAATPLDWQAAALARLTGPELATVSLYAQGRDYHKVLRQRLQTLADRLQQAVGRLGHRVFTDSAPVLEVELAQRSGIGWRGKHTLALSREGGSMFFLGEIFIDFALPLTAAADAHCGQCRACLDICPTGAIVAPYRLDARRCISYLTIEHDGPIPEPLRAAIGNRVYGCDDCQLACPWNKFAQRSALPDFDPRPAVGDATLLQLWAWSEADFLRHTEGSAIRRIGYRRWRRNLAVALGNAWRDGGEVAVAAALQDGLAGADELVAEHIRWALAQRAGQRPTAAP